MKNFKQEVYTVDSDGERIFTIYSDGTFKGLEEHSHSSVYVRNRMHMNRDRDVALATLDKDVWDEIARFLLEVSNAVAAGRLPDGTVTLSQDEALALLGKVNAIDAAVKAAGNS